ncbi:MAG: glycosyltransferase family 4 protein [Clostridium sp.]|nr:glycosyltransferase family 4 protein [Clostridium sp.]
MKKILFISNHAGFSKFNAPYMQWFHEQGWQVDNVSPGIETGYYDNQYDLPISRSPFSFSNIKALKDLKKICKENEYDLIHCHTPVGGVLGRLCVKNKKCNTKVIYTAHGFHFFKGAPKFNWVLYFTIEKILSKRTDCIVTINDEDYQIASKYFKTKVRKIDGVGVDLRRFVPLTSEEKTVIREKNGFSENDFLLVYCAQFIPRKNHIFLLDNVAKLQNIIPNLKLCLVGNGKDEDKIKKYAESKKLDNIVRFLGYRRDVESLYAMADILVSTSLQEGFGINLVEGMACNLPVVASNVRGHRDILNIAKGNFLFEFTDNSFVTAINSLYVDKEMRTKIGKQNISYAKNFSVDNSLVQMGKIYNEIIGK